MTGRDHRSDSQFWAPIAFLVSGLLVWDLAIRLLGIEPFLLPSPLQVCELLWTRKTELISASWLTLQATLCGFVMSIVVGIGVALLFSEFRWIRLGGYPYAILLNTVPIVAISPLIITWFGYGFQSVVVITFILSLFPIIASTTNGLMRTSEELMELFQLYRASRWQRLWRLKLPSAVPQISSGLQTSSGLSVVGAIIGEFFAGHEANQYGLGYYIFAAQGQFRTDLLFAAVLLSTALGVLVFLGVTLASHTLLRRWMVAE